MGILNKLTVVGVARLKRRGRHSDGGGLFLNIGPGRRSWLFKYERSGRRREMGLGPYPEIGLAAARELARQCREQLAKGEDPIDSRQARRAAESRRTKPVGFAECAERYLAVKRHELRSDKSVARWERFARYASEAFGDKPVDQIETDDVVKLLEPRWHATPETAAKLREAVELMLDHAAALGLRRGENPARWKGHLSHILPTRNMALTVVHHRSLPYAEMHELTAALRASGAPAARALELLALTATRTSEVLEAEWSEVDLDAALWVIPAERTKTAKLHRVPLSVQAIAVLRRQAEWRWSDYMFPGQRQGRPLSQMAGVMWVRKHGWADRFTPHGLRSTFRTWTEERTNFPREIAETALGHSVGNAVEKAYQRGDMLEKRRKLMQDWGNFCDNPSQPR